MSEAFAEPCRDRYHATFGRTRKGRLRVSYSSPHRGTGGLASSCWLPRTSTSSEARLFSESVSHAKSGTSMGGEEGTWSSRYSMPNRSPLSGGGASVSGKGGSKPAAFARSFDFTSAHVAVSRTCEGGVRVREGKGLAPCQWKPPRHRSGASSFGFADNWTCPRG